MPEELRNYHGDTDWVKIIMAASTAVLFVLQGIGFKMHETTKDQVSVIHSNYVPASEIMPRSEVMQKQDLVLMLKAINSRINSMEAHRSFDGNQEIQNNQRDYKHHVDYRGDENHDFRRETNETEVGSRTQN